MKAETPAQGILKINDWGNSIMYKAVCQCGQDECSHVIDIEAEDNDVSVILYTTEKTKFWQFNRWQKMWTLLTKGYIEYEASIIMNKQTALNYAETLKSAVMELEKNVKPRTRKSN